jgi:predicted GNAT family N-acyltransferase
MIIFTQTNDDIELKQAFNVRTQVFIEEQGISRDEEWDGLDSHATQFIAKNGDAVIATARVRFPAVEYAKIERMAVLKPFRNQGIGKQLLLSIEKHLMQKQIPKAILHAQWPAIPFYQACGYVRQGKSFFEADIKHVEMYKEFAFIK